MIASNSVGCWARTASAVMASMASRTSATASAKASSSIGAPAISMRSLKRVRCGELRNPVLRPAARRPAAIIAAVEPLPLVPATCTIRKDRSGRPSRSVNALIRAKPKLAPPLSPSSESR